MSWGRTGWELQISSAGPDQPLGQYIIQQHGNELSGGFAVPGVSHFHLCDSFHPLLISKTSKNCSPHMLASIHGSQAGKGLLFR